MPNAPPQQRSIDRSDIDIDIDIDIDDMTPRVGVSCNVLAKVY
jgi:hypothetical protein